MFSKSCPTLFRLVAAANKIVKSNGIEKTKISAFTGLSSAIGASGQFTNSLIYSIRCICAVNDALDQSIWAILPVVFAVSVWFVAFDDTAVYNIHHDGKFC